MSTHADLVARAQSLFGGTIVAETTLENTETPTYEEFRDQLFALFRTEMAHVTDRVERYHIGMQIACRCANGGHPFWIRIIEEIGNHIAQAAERGNVSGG